MPLLRLSSLVGPLLILALATPALAQEHKGVRYTLPAGWTERSEGDAKVFVAPGLKDNEALVVLLTPAAAATGEPPARQFESVVASANAEVKVRSRGQAASTPREGGTLMLQGHKVEDANIGAHSRLYAMLFAGGRRTLAIVIVKPEAVLKRHEDAVLALINSLRIAGVAQPSAPSGPGAGLPSAAPTPQHSQPTPAGTPTGETPDLFPGMPGWLPSGRGVPIPPAAIVGGKPQGLWWTMSYGGGQRAATFVFLPDGIHASNPRYGGGNLFDVEGQRRQRGATGVGRFSIEGGQITRLTDGHRSTDPYSTGTDPSGPFFKIGGGIFRPIAAPTRQMLTGTWRAAGTQYIFHADGRYEMGQVAQGAGWATGTRIAGTHSIDGHLVVLRPQGAPITIVPIAFLSRELILIHGVFYRRS